MYLHKNLTTVEEVPVAAGKGVSIQVLLSSAEAPNFAMRRFAIAPGGFMPHHTNTVEHEQFVLGGRAKVRIGEETFEAKANDVLLIPAGAAHSYETVGDESYQFLCLIPNQEDEICIVEG